MPDIQFICLSDLHFGSYNSLLTYTSQEGKLDVGKNSEVLVQLLNVLEEIIGSVNKKRKAKFILNGDIFELALANTNEAVMTFDSFLSLAYTKKRKEIFSDKMIYIPGNHDHHLWETARERQYLEYMIKRAPGEFIELPWHHTKMIKPNPLKSRFITTLIQRHKNLSEGRAMTVYPNLTLVNREKEKYIVITHGHFIESIYYLMSNLQSILLNSKSFPETIDQIERENFAWIDFFWSVLGRSGEVGTNIGLMYDMLQDEKALNDLANNLVTYLMNRGDFPGSLQNMLKPIVGYILTKVVSQIAINERGLTDDILGKDARQGLFAYINGPLKLQFLSENNNTLPKEMNFIFGHTHKPFCKKEVGFEESGYPKEIGIMNTGGWVIDTVEPQKQVGGAITLIDEDKNVVLLRLYNETNLEIKLESSELENPLYKKLSEKLNLKSKTFTEFTKSIDLGIQNKRTVIKNRISK
ncbi:MAG: metallophosphoesterase [Leptospiraceae bacterium]|nr:metallophosphoesterase [Leptospiraceae bacterium]